MIDLRSFLPGGILLKVFLRKLEGMGYGVRIYRRLLLPWKKASKSISLSTWTDNSKCKEPAQRANMTRLSVKQAQALGIIPGPKPKKQSLNVTKAKWDAERMPGGVKFIIPENMPSLNVWKNWHWAKQMEYKDYLTRCIHDLTFITGKPQYEKAKIEITHYFRVNRDRDFDNAAPKFLLDALRYARVIQEDHSGVLQLPEPVFKMDRVCWRTEVSVWEVSV